MYRTCDTEVPGLAARKGLKPFIVSACDEDGKALAWEWSVDPFTRSVSVNGIDIIDIKDYFTGHEIIFQHGQFDLRILANAGVLLRTPYWTVPKPYPDRHYIYIDVPRIHDTLFMSHLVDSRGVYIKGQGKKGAKSSHGLKQLGLVRLGVSDLDEIKLKKAVNSARLKAGKLGWKIGKRTEEDYWIPQALFEYRHGQTAATDSINVPVEWDGLARDYALFDARDRTMQLFLTCKEILQDDDRWDMYLEETELLPIFYMMEEAGLTTSKERLNEQRRNNRAKAAKYETEMIELAGDPDLNINSDDQLRKLLFEKWKQKPTKTTEKKKIPSVAAETLSTLRDSLASTGSAPWAKRHKTDQEKKALRFLECLIGKPDDYAKDPKEREITPGYRQHLKMNGYLDFYAREAIDDIFHAQIHPVGTATTRISTKGSQNIGKKKVDGVSCRSAFGPLPGHIWVSIDYAQLELRIFGGMSGDITLQQAFDEGYDFHAFVATKIFNLPPEKISDEQRRIAKNTNFAMIYGGSAGKVDATAGMPGAYAAFSKQFPSARSFMDDTISTVKDQCYIETADGYPLYAPLNEPFKATDYRIQGTAGRIIKRAMKWLMYGRSGFELLETQSQFLELKPIVDWKKIIMRLQIHDELVFDIDTKGLSRNNVVRIIRQIMTVMEEAGQSMGLVTPVSATIHTQDWGQGITVKEYLNGRKQVSAR